MEQYIPTYDSFASGHASGYVPTGRLQVMSSVYLPASEIDFVSGQLQPDRLRRRRTQGLRLEQERLDQEEKKLRETLARESSKGGVRISLRAMVMIVCVTMFLCGFYLLTQQGMIAECQKSINRQNRNIEKVLKDNQALEASIAEACTEAKICYAASKNLNMIRSEEVGAIHMTALATRPLGEKSNSSADNLTANNSSATTYATAKAAAGGEGKPMAP